MAHSQPNPNMSALPFPFPFPDNWTQWGPEAGTGGRGDVVQGSLLVAIAVLGAALNLFLMLAILPNPRMRSVRQVLLVHLAIVGLVTSLVLTLPAGILQLLTSLDSSSSPSSPWPGSSSSSSSSSSLQSSVEKGQHVVAPSPNPSPAPGEEPGLAAGALCRAVGAGGVLLTAASVWTVAALAWDKHRAIANPLHHPLVARRSTMAAWLALLWTLAAALAMPPVLGGGDLRFVPALARCGMHAGSPRGRWHALLVVLVGVVAPLSVMLYCYTHIFRIARAQSSRIAATMLRMVTLIQAPIAPPPARNAGLVRLRGTRAMATIVQLVGSCVASYVPWAVLLCHQAATRLPPAGLPAATAAILLHAAPLTAATVYGVRNRNLRASFARFVSRRFQHWCRPHRRRPSVKSLRNSSSAAVSRKQAAHNGLSPTVSGMRRTFSLQSPGGRRGVEVGRGGLLQAEAASDALLPRPQSCGVLPAFRDLPFSADRPLSDLHDVIEMNSEFPAAELELDSEYPGMLERETVT